MSDLPRVLLVGATGLIGSLVIERAVRSPALRLIALARRDTPVPAGIELAVADPAQWAAVIAGLSPDAVICALGTTRRTAGSAQAFRAVDHDMVVAVAQSARKAGTARFVLVSSVGADPHARGLYLRVKGQVEAAVAALDFARVDVLRPGLLRGKRAERRILERLAMVASPVTDRLLHGGSRRFRAVDAREVAAAALHFAAKKEPGRVVHEHDGIVRGGRMEGTL